MQHILNGVAMMNRLTKLLGSFCSIQGQIETKRWLQRHVYRRATVFAYAATLIWGGYD